MDTAINPSYIFSGHTLSQEWQRLKAQNEGFSRYLNGKLSLAPLDNPKDILDMGTGSGSWAIEAASLYPEANVIAADMSPVPKRDYPPNFQFQQLNLLDEFPWMPQSFDVIHMRLVMWHIPHASKFIARVTPLLKPNGYLIIEDCCLLSYPTAMGPAQRKRNEITSAFLLAKNLDPYIGEHLEGFMQSTGEFQDIFVHKEILTFTPLTDDPHVRPLAEAMREAVIQRQMKAASSAWREAGMTPELQASWKEEMENPQYDPTQHFYFVWGRKKA